VFLAVWLIIVAAVIGGNLPAKFDDAQSNESTSFLPGNAESTAALAATEEIQGGDELLPLVIVYQSEEGPLDAADRERIESDREALNADLPRRTDPYTKPIPSKDGTAALLTAQIHANGEGDTITRPVDQARAQVESSAQPGVETAVTGGAGLSADAIDVFDSINGTLLLATAGIVFLLLLIVYRSPIFWFFPLFAVGVAELATRGVGFALT
jgi:RND superfamily putative drug exporter